MTLYCLKSNDVHSTYSELSVLRDYPGALGTTSGADPNQIDSIDLELYKLNTGKPYAVKLYSPESTEIFLEDENSLNAVLNQLNTAGTATRKDVWVDIPEIATTATTYTLDEINNFFRDSTFAIEIRSDISRSWSSSGTGSVAECQPQADGSYLIRVLTNAHIAGYFGTNTIGFQIFNASDQLVSQDVTLIGMDPIADVGVLEFVSPIRYRVVADLNNTAVASPRESLFEIGNTKGLGVNTQIVSVSRDEINFGAYVMTLKENYPFKSYFIRGDVRGGNSGSPIVNQYGQFVALHFGGTKIEDGQNQYWEGSIAHAERIKTSYQNILDHRDTHGVVYSDWGITVQTFMESDAFWQNHPQLNHKGVIVGKIAADGPTARSGLLAGDVIVSATTNGMTTEFDIHDEEQIHPFSTYVLDSDVSKTYELSIYRPSDKSFHTLTITPRARAYLPPDYFTTEQGFGVANIQSTTLIYHDDFLSTHQGLVFDNPEKNPFGSAQMHYDQMLITEINGIPTTAVKVFTDEYLRCKNAGAPYTLTIESSPRSYLESDGGPGITYYETFRFY